MVVERGFHPVHVFVRADPAEIVRRDHRQQVQTEVGRRGPMRQHGLRVFLEVVGRKHVIFRRHKGLEEAPGAAGDQSERASRRRRERLGSGNRGGGSTHRATAGESIQRIDERSRDRPLPRPRECTATAAAAIPSATPPAILR